MAEAELVGLLVEAAQRFFDAIEVAAFLAGEEQHLLALHGVGAEIRHVIRVGIHVGVLRIGGLLGELVELAERAQRALALAQQPLLKVLDLLLGQLLGCCHVGGVLRPPVGATETKRGTGAEPRRRAR